jgi:hypothetical protein
MLHASSCVGSLMRVRLGARRVVAAAEDELRSHLDSGEKLLWAGRPAQGIVFTRQDWFFIPFSAVWLGIAVLGVWPKSTKTSEPLASSRKIGASGSYSDEGS